MTTTTDHLATYLQDHLAGSTAGLELVRRAAAESGGEPLGAHLDGLANDIEQERDALRAIMEQLGVTEGHVKVAAAWFGEKLTRLKPDGHLLGSSPLRRYEELEGLSLGIEGKRLLWLVLADAGDDRLDSAHVIELAERAAHQREELEPFRQAAARTAFT